jgi:2-succinyl-6-hydroxy-2,4-cyclohexadiene-1-carboxylate synthase
MRSLRFESYGQVSGPVLVCVHGFLGCAKDWRGFAEALPDWRVIAVLLPGHDGESPGDFDGRLMATLDGLGVRSAGLVGYSMGGRLGLRVALDFPERFPFFVGVSTTAGLEEGREERLAADRLLAERLRGCDARGFEIFLREWWGLPVFESPKRSAEGFKEFLASRRGHDPRWLAECLEVWSPGVLPSLWDRLPGYPGRAMLVAGECDVRYSLLAERMAGAFRFGSREILPGCGHRVLEEDPERLARYVSEFLESANFGIGRTSLAD